MRLRNLFFAVLLCILGPYTAYPAWLFDGTNDYVSMADNAALTLPDGDWTIAGWVKLTSNAGTGENRLIDWWDGADEYIEWAIREDTYATTAERGDIAFGASDGTDEVFSVSTGTPPFTSNTNWTHVILQRSGNTVTQYINATANGADTNANFDAVDPAVPWYFGATVQDGVAGVLNGALAEWAKWDRALTPAEISALAAGFAPNCFSNGLTSGSAWLAPMLGGVYQELVNAISVTNNETVPAPHPRMYSCN